jgi:hypothetical protein
MAPHRFEIENDEPFLGGRAGKQLVVPAIPLDGLGCERWRHCESGDGENQNADEFHNVSRSVGIGRESYAGGQNRARCFSGVTES